MQLMNRPIFKSFYDYKAGMDELRRFNQINHYRDNLMAKLNHFDKLQLKEQRF